MDISRKSTLFLAYAYEFDQDGESLMTRSEAWKRREIKGVALLPHLDEYVRKGELLRAYDVTGDLRAAFGARDPWKLVDGADGSVEITITDPPRIYVLDTHYAFIVIGVAPFVKKGEELTLATMQDVSYALVRAGIARVAGTSPQMTKWIETHELGAKEPPILRRWLAALVPGLRAEAPRGAPRTTAPALFSVILAKEPLGSDDRHRLRLVHRSDQFVEAAGVSNGDETGEWRVSNRELCLFSTFGVSWVVTTDDAAQSSHFLNDAPHMVRDRYVYKWLLVEHQRLCLLALATECADMSKGIDGSNFAEMRMRLLTFISTYNFRHVSNEERHDRFYKRVRDALSIDDLLAEVSEEVVEIDTQLAARRAELLNHVLAFLTLVLTPVGIMCAVFGSDTVPGQLRFHDFVSASSWLSLITHAPFLIVLAAAITGATIYVRIFGARNLFRQLRKLKKK
ncbi:MAG: hypothetical protein M4D80_24430 [Myxococcota bacterium]|nr:hypothetical protein [Myxococcota bacterium]